MGFRFKPTNEEIISLLKKKRLDPGFSVHTIREIDFYSFDPEDLTRHSEIQCEEEVWYFYSERYYMCAKSKRAHRRTKSGYWKVTGTGSDIKRKNSTEVIGTKKILTFCPRRSASKKAKTEWVMHEIAVEDDPLYKVRVSFRTSFLTYYASCLGMNCICILIIQQQLILFVCF